MRSTQSVIAVALVALALCGAAQTFVTNKLDSAQAAKLASGFSVGTSEWAIYSVLWTNGLAGMTVGNTFSGTAVYQLRDGCLLKLELSVEPGTMTNRVLRSASISSNGVKVTSIALKKRH